MSLRFKDAVIDSINLGDDSTWSYEMLSSSSFDWKKYGWNYTHQCRNLACMRDANIFHLCRTLPEYKHFIVTK
jgi:hypothetical protein